ncbi:MAG: hypothetical protein LC793_13100 [Thermomicrobia bacterium]|nr:hypothetical protein [Thermomicrobia bacterium]MCA1722754.1 hypothetical protein [Thermomicrobia bacterium]
MPARFAIRCQEHHTRDRGYWLSEYAVPITDVRDLPKETDFKASAPLDALVQFCERHAWHTRAFPTTEHPPVPMDGVIAPSGYPHELLAVRVEPVAVVASMTKDRTKKYEGTYRVRLA